MGKQLFGSTHALQALTVVLLLGPCALRVEAFQGTASPGALPRPAPHIQTNLPPITVDFRDIAPKAGLTAVNVSGGADKKSYILETTGNGVLIFDYDNDGLMDVFLPNATTLDGQGRGKTSTSHLYHNLGNLHFEDVTEKAGLGKIGWGQGACAADYDNDGFTDLFVTYYGHSVLYRNQGDGTFKDVTETAGLKSDAIRWDTGCSFFDYDLDGKVDLVVSGYVEFDRNKIPEPGASGYCMWKGLSVIPVTLCFFIMKAMGSLAMFLLRPASENPPVVMALQCWHRTSTVMDIPICTSLVIRGPVFSTTTRRMERLRRMAYPLEWR